jgi:hypothetical protein
MNNNILAIVFLMAGMLLTTTAVPTMIPAAYADNKNQADDDSAAAIADCDDRDVEETEFECIDIGVNDVELDFGSILGGLTGLGDSE